MICQQDCLSKLNQFASSNQHSVVIEGPKGSGKTFMAKMFSSYINSDDFSIIHPKIEEIRDCVDNLYKINNKTVVCVENLDEGVLGCAYTLLKSLEEPRSNVYFVVTCSSINSIPDTIVSRCVVCSISPPRISDVNNYIKKYHSDKNANTYQSLLSCATSFSDADYICSLSFEQCQYIESLSDVLNFKEPISSLSWKLSHFSDNSEAPVKMIIRYLTKLAPTPYIKNCGIECLNYLDTGRISLSSILGKYLFKCKYCE